ncbi:MAG TPA: phosphatidylglycerophosphatase A [Flavisolibacter sp.]|nr:phosphatidylglycerophosphatase A [Flavisolibacter sp.]
MIFIKLIATCLGIGYLQKGAGTIAALFCCVVWYLLRLDRTDFSVQLAVIGGFFFLGAWTATIVEKVWGHDSNRIVVDEWMGMSVALFLIPFTWISFLTAFVLFRFFDIAKPVGIRKAEAVSGGWGVMLDDLLAGIYSNLILHLLIKSHLF